MLQEQFPLVQRQWDAVAPLRAQITYKATLSLRDSNASLEVRPSCQSALDFLDNDLQDICSTLLMLHLLESRPWIDVLTVFLTQRARSLQATLSRSPKSVPNRSSLNGGPLSKSKKAAVREVREGLEAVLEAIASTVGVTRDVFRNRGHEDPSLMSRVLSFIQSDVPPQDSSLPSDLQMSTQHLLSSLPSASHFVLLPSNIRSYKPFVDSASATSSVSSVRLAGRISEWFSKAVAELRGVAKGWFSELRTLKEVWAIRSWFVDWLRAKELEDGERQGLAEVVDDVVHDQAVKILRIALGDLQDDFRNELQNALSQLRDGTTEAFLGMFTNTLANGTSKQTVCE
jgi:conserved oligomeric Golgi complex subunit 1